MLIGPVGAGKTTFARRLERDRNAIRFSLDEWMTHLYGHHMSRELFNARLELCMELILNLTERLSALGVDVVLDCGFWKRRDRRSVRERLVHRSVDVNAYFLDIPREARWQRLEERNLAIPAGTFEITREMFEQFDGWFEPPDGAETVHVIREADGAA